MCKDKKIYNTENEQIYDSHLLPGLMLNNPCKETFKNWLKLRYSSNTNSIARQLKGVTFGQGNRIEINKNTYALSLSDCYWLKDEDDSTLFSQVSPYYNDFWKGINDYAGGSIPTLYVGGFLTKEWVNKDYLHKYGKETLIEAECSFLCNLCKIPVAQVTLIKNGISIKNITNTNLMLEQGDQSGRLDPDDFSDKDIIDLFGLRGIQMLIIDAIVGNGDRHAGNFGWIRNTDTGQYISMAPLYDFDHALDTTKTNDRLTDSIKHIDNKKEISRICNIVIENTTNNIFKNRAKTILHNII